MTDLTAIAPSPTRQAVAVRGRSAPGKVTGKLKTAIDAMVWQGARRAEAAETGGITDHSLRSALNKPHVKAYYLHQLEVLRTSERARNIQRLAEIRDKADNMPAVQAIKLLEQIGDETPARSGASASVPGLVIQVINNAAPQQEQPAVRVIEGDKR